MRTSGSGTALLAVLLVPFSATLSATPATAQVTWLPLSPLRSPPARAEHGMAYDPVRNRTVLFGGFSWPNVFNDTWEWDGLLWHQLTPTGGPSPRRGFGIAWDGASQKVLLFGGVDGNQNWFGQTWTWDGTTWVMATPGASPPPRSECGMAYDSVRNRVVVFGGVNSTGDLNDTWEWDGTTWTQRQPANNPGRRRYCAMAFDARRGRSVLYFGETWEWDGTVWSLRANSGPPSPGPALAFDEIRRRVVAFGGGSNPPQADTWEWDGATWTRLAPLVSPPARNFAAGAFAGPQRRMVLFGGYGYNASADTWEMVTDCRVIGAGHPGGGQPITCRTAPVLGGNFCVGFGNGPSVGLLLLGPAPCETPIATIDPPLFCARGSVYPLPIAVLTVSGDPALLCLPVPFDPALHGVRLCLQGLGLQVFSCFRATDGIEAALRL